MSQSVVYEILQDTKGYLWFATQDGVSRFDGVDFLNISTDAGLIDNMARTMKEMPDGTIWVGTDKGISVISEDRKTVTTLMGFPRTSVRSIHVGMDGTKWIGTIDGGLIHWNGSVKKVYTKEDGLIDTKIYTIIQSRDYALWIGTERGVSHFKNGVFMNYNVDNGLHNNRVRSLLETLDGDILVSGYGGSVSKISKGKVQQLSGIPHFASQKINAMHYDLEGNIWFATDGEGALFYNGKTFELISANEGFSNGSLQSIACDTEGNMWFGTWGSGVFQLVYTHIRWITTTHGLIGENVSSITRDAKGRLWVGTNNNGLAILNGKEVIHLDERKGLPSNRIFALQRDDKRNVMWIGTDKGLVRYQNHRFDIIKKEDGLKNESVRVLALDKDNHLWIGTFGSGVFMYDDKTFTQYTKKDGMLNDSVFVIQVIPDGSIWFGSDGGISIMNPEGKIFESFTEKDGLVSNRISSVFRSSDGSIWIGTYSGGVSRYKNNKFFSYNTRMGLSNNLISFIIEDANGFIWIGTKNGVNRFDGEFFTVYNSQTGLVSDETNPRTAYFENNKLWFGTVKGVNQIDLGKEKINMTVPPVYITGFKLFDKDTAMVSNLKLNYWQNYIRLEYSAISFSNPGRVRYQYMLEGLDPDWIMTDTRTVQYTSLKPGKYTFKVRAMNNDGLWNEAGATYPFEIIPPFWATKWFMSVMALMLFSMIVLSVQYRERQLKKRNAELESQVMERTKALQKSEEQFRLISENAADLICVTDLSGLALYISPSIEKLLGYRPDALVDKNVSDIIHPDDAQEVMATMTARIQRDGVVNTEVRLLTKQGEWRNFIIAANSVTAGEVSDHRVVIVGHDITDRKRTEEELMRSKQEAEAANKAKSHFLASMSHELRTPLNAILGFSQILEKDTQIPSRYRDYVKIMYKSGDHLLSMINDILDLSKIEAGRMELSMKHFNMRDLLNDLYNMFKVQAADKNLRLNLEISPEFPSQVLMDNHKMRQVLINLIGNAVKYTQKGRVDVVAGIHPEKPDHLKIEVRDTGVGISEQDIEHIFEAFHQAVQHQTKGTGLGLTISMKLAQLMNGQIEVKSEQHVGSTFALVVPFEVSHQHPTRTVLPIVDAKTDLAKAKFLLVDDVEENLLLLEEILLQFPNAKVLKARNGRQCMEVLETFKPDYIFMDIVMPEMDGKEALRLIRMDPLLKRIPVVAITASVFEGSKDELIALGFDDFILKPCVLDEVIASVRRFVPQLNVENDTSDDNKTEPRIQTLIGETDPVKLVELLQDDVKAELAEAVELMDMMAMTKVVERMEMGLLKNRLHEAIHSNDYRFFLSLDELLNP